MALHRYLVKSFVNLKAIMREGQNHEGTVILAWVWWFIVSVLVGTVVHLFRDLFESLKTFMMEPLVILTSRLTIELMMKLSDK
jgi:hypothetical protein